MQASTSLSSIASSVSSNSSTSGSRTVLNTEELHTTASGKGYFAKLRQSHRLLLVLNDYDCQCGCHFSMQQGSYVILYESSSNNDGFVTVISTDLVCSKVPRGYLCDLERLRKRVRSRRLCHTDEPSFDL